MPAFLAALKVALQLLPLLGSMIKVVETLVPQGGQGAQKLLLIRNMLESAYATVDGATASFAQVWPLLEPAIAGLVTLYKQTGVFASAPTQGS